ncbi:hypothetical protein OG402_38520 [Streptomyces anulatus]|uniref:hypothetical protein n=1 Tax=Streptomyces anulatus TaxID=1892 RepID=UPI002257C42F|nr:hypothetical protein [Streptomyces anulatus]MCX4523329.1 hypothetical protein [Streptomyces anulatus]MCX4606339.1 hypothetical protein [Streptomyces anulatus]
MDLQGVGALAAAGVAAASVPVVLIVGRWQLRATLRAADAAQRAGNEQAQATYRAALDAVKAQAAASHNHWRRGTQRDAYAAFLLADHQHREASDGLPTRIDSDPTTLARLRAEVESTKGALRAAYVAVDLEGPGDLAFIADSIVTHAFLVADARQREAAMERALIQLVEMSVEESRGGVDAASRDRARNCVECLVRLQMAVQQGPWEGDPRALPGGTPDELAQLTYDVFTAMDSVGDGLSQADKSALLDMHFAGRPQLRPGYEQWNAELERARREFVRAARTELGAS